MRVINRFNASHGSALELFAPTYVVREDKDGKINMRTINLTFHYVFVKGTLAEVKRLCGQDNGFSFVLDHSGAGRYATVIDKEMANFKNIARAYNNCLPYFALNDIDLEEGDLVEVINGDFPGLIGTYMPRLKSNSGNIILRVFNKVGTIAFDVKAKDVRVLEFSQKSTRVNDQLDAIVPHLFKALRYYKMSEALPNALIAKLSIFSNRMCMARLNNRKLNARLQAILYGCNIILGNSKDAAQAKTNYEKVKTAVTNVWTLALINLIYAVVDNDHERLISVCASLKESTPSSKSQLMLTDELRFYNVC